MTSATTGVLLAAGPYRLSTLPADTGDFQRWAANPAMMHPMNLPTAQLSAPQIAAHWPRFDNDSRFFFTIRDAQERGLGFWQVERDPDHDTATLQVAIDPAHQGRGVALATAIALIDWLFDQRQVAKIFVLTLPGNAALQALMARTGFVREGLLRQEIKNLTGTGPARHDQLRFGLILFDWAACRSDIQSHFNSKFGKTL